MVVTWQMTRSVYCPPCFSETGNQRKINEKYEHTLYAHSLWRGGFLWLTFHARAVVTWQVTRRVSCCSEMDNQKKINKKTWVYIVHLPCCVANLSVSCFVWGKVAMVVVTRQMTRRAHILLIPLKQVVSSSKSKNVSIHCTPILCIPSLSLSLCSVVYLSREWHR